MLDDRDMLAEVLWARAFAEHHGMAGRFQLLPNVTLLCEFDTAANYHDFVARFQATPMQVRAN